MINPTSLEAVAAARLDDHFVRPRYDGFGFAQLPQTVRRVLLRDQGPGVSFGSRTDLDQQYDTVILFFVDAFGWRFFAEFAEHHPFLRRIVDEGAVSKLTSQFPSTTAAHVTTMHTGLPVGQSGVYEWFYYEPRLDALIAPLLFSYAGDHERDRLVPTGVAPSELFPTETLYQELAGHGVHSYVFQYQAYAHSPYTRVVTAGATIVPYRTLPEAIVNLHQLLAVQQERSYYFLYYDSIDAICHLYGPESPHTRAEILAFLDIMERIFHANFAERRRSSLLLVTADHGQTSIDPATTIYLNRALPRLQALLKTNRLGRPLVPAGSNRDMFLHVREDRLDEAQGMLQEHLAGKAEVRRVRDLVEDNFFGVAPPSQTFLARVGDLVILPYRHESVWWYEQGRFENVFRGNHGGLTGDEMETMVLARRYA